ncbi:hypothetical protein ACFQ1M_13940 [Sungkyunkwania multivorans]|uniref:Uncharacterized protein n=1 Tax=Sungkyunkwania multivorans TaxID=1173618 RepID=A0ABW3D2M7_9FLAO
MKFKRRNSIFNPYSLKLVLPILLIVFICITTAFVSDYDETWAFDWRSIRPEIKAAVKKIETKEMIFMGQNKTAYENQSFLRDCANHEELKRLTEYPFGAVKAIAYEGLLRRNLYGNNFVLIKKAIADDSQIGLKGGCFIFPISIDEYLNSRYLRLEIKTTIPQPPPPPLPEGFVKKTYGLSPKEQEILSKLMGEKHEKFHDKYAY